jgi:hypothetical protein
MRLFRSLRGEPRQATNFESSGAGARAYAQFCPVKVTAGSGCRSQRPS